MQIDLDMANNMFGKLDPELRTRLTAAIERPSEETWNDAYSILLNFDGPGVGMGLTLWQAVLAVDPDFGSVKGPTSRWVDDDSERGGHSEPLSGWARTPTAETIAQAINYATR